MKCCIDPGRTLRLTLARKDALEAAKAKDTEVASLFKGELLDNPNFPFGEEVIASEVWSWGFCVHRPSDPYVSYAVPFAGVAW